MSVRPTRKGVTTRRPSKGQKALKHYRKGYVFRIVVSDLERQQAIWFGGAEHH